MCERESECGVCARCCGAGMAALAGTAGRWGGGVSPACTRQGVGRGWGLARPAFIPPTVAAASLYPQPLPTHLLPLASLPLPLWPRPLASPQIVLLLDADFLPNRALTDLIHQPAMYEQLRRVTGGPGRAAGAAGARARRSAGVLRSSEWQALGAAVRVGPGSAAAGFVFSHPPCGLPLPVVQATSRASCCPPLRRSTTARRASRRRSRPSRVSGALASACSRGEGAAQAPLRALLPCPAPPRHAHRLLPPPMRGAGRAALHELFDRGELRGFHMDHYNRGHRWVGGWGVGAEAEAAPGRRWGWGCSCGRRWGGAAAAAPLPTGLALAAAAGGRGGPALAGAGSRAGRPCGVGPRRQPALAHRLRPAPPLCRLPPPPPRCRRATDHSRWFETSISYRIPYEEGFEPYVLVQRRFVPWYDERFKGYRKNKVGAVGSALLAAAGGRAWWRHAGSCKLARPRCHHHHHSTHTHTHRPCLHPRAHRRRPPPPPPQVVHLMHMFRLGVEFASTPHGYVVHSPHPVANSWNTTQATGFWYKVCMCVCVWGGGGVLGVLCVCVCGGVCVMMCVCHGGWVGARVVHACGPA